MCWVMSRVFIRCRGTGCIWRDEHLEEEEEEEEEAYPTRKKGYRVHHGDGGIDLNDIGPCAEEEEGGEGGRNQLEEVLKYFEKTLKVSHDVRGDVHIYNTAVV
mmetsp:Transcript_6598/g.6836  ORF Transcript_6598/g.6836 Transcript_6598/m.6836 type:complete len:103 (-) Transcript_6598:107-415(-)